MDGYEPDEPTYDDADLGDYEEVNNNTADPDAPENGNTIVEFRDPSGRPGVTTQTSRDKKIPKEKRNTTPYMTKYERARVLGVRSLQIR